MSDEINERLDKLEAKLNTLITTMDNKNYAENSKYKNMLQQWFSLLFKEVKKEINLSKKEIIKELNKK